MKMSKKSNSMTVKWMSYKNYKVTTKKQLEFGQIKVQKILLEQSRCALDTREQELQTEYEGLQKKERDLVQKYIDKYGKLVI